MNDVELVYFPNVNNLEGPIWDQKRKAIWCVAIEEGYVLCVSETGQLIRKYDVKSQVGCIALKEEYFLAATYKGIYRVEVDSGEMTFIKQILPNKKIRFNDGKLDAKGRFLLGTTGYNRLAPGENFLYSFDGNEVKELVRNTTISNGLDFSKDNKNLYFVDTPLKKIARYKYNIDDGTAEYIDSPIQITGKGLPDGICMDLDGNLWVAEWGAGRVCKWNIISGSKEREIHLPVKNVSSCCLGGISLNTLYITTAKHDDEKQNEELASGLFRVIL